MSTLVEENSTSNGIPTWNENATDEVVEPEAEEDISESIFERNGLSCLSYVDKPVTSAVLSVTYLNCLILANNRLQCLPDEITLFNNLQVSDI